MKLFGKSAIVTGAGRGIGKEIALAYAAEGAELILFARTSSEVEALANQIEDDGGKAIAVRGDVRSEKDVKEMVKEALEQFGRIDILVNNAGINFGKAVKPHLKDMTLEDFMMVMNTNLIGTFLCCREVLAPMTNQKSGIIINMLGMGSFGYKASPGYSAYNCSKAAIERLSTVLAQEVAPFNIRVFSLHPGSGYRTGFTRSGGVERSDKLHPEIVRPLAVFLASAEPQDASGRTFNVPEWNKEHGFPVY